MNEKLSELLTAISALSELMGVYRDGLMRNGFTRNEAVELCKEYTAILLKPHEQKEEE